MGKPLTSLGRSCPRFCHQPSGILRLPIGNENIGLMGNFAVAARDPDQLLAAGTEHGKAVEAVAVGDALNIPAVEIDGVQFEVAHASARADIRRKNNAFAVGKERGCETGGAEIGELSFVAAV